MYKFKYETFTERTKILEENKDKFLIEEQNLFGGNYLIFSEEELPQNPAKPSEIEIMQGKISILEEENKSLRQELSITQDAINELIFNSLNI